MDIKGDGHSEESYYRPAIDIDGDGIDDNWKPNINVEYGEDNFHYDTYNPNINIDTDGDGTPDINIDIDGDGAVSYTHLYEINHQQLKDKIIDLLNPQLFIDMNEIKYNEAMIQQRLGQFITEDRINGVFVTGDIQQYFDLDKVVLAQQKIQEATGLVVIFGVGAGIMTHGDIFVYNNITIQRIKDGYFSALSNWGAHNENEDPLTKEKRFNFVESRLLDNHKRHMLSLIHIFASNDKFCNQIWFNIYNCYARKCLCS